MSAAADPFWGCEPAPEPSAGDRVVIGVSGGVDSAVAMQRLVDRGCDVVAVTTKNFCFDTAPFDQIADSGSCCSQDAVLAARDLSAQLGASHSVLDLTEPFRGEVIDDYVHQFQAGLTPSPCVRCNSFVRFPQLLAFADQVGAQWVATGHYARIVRDSRGEFFVARGTDAAKDQSYFLFRLPSSTLARLTFPLGSDVKPAVREEAAEHGLAVARTPDSQELCFVPDGNRDRLLAATAVPGDIVDQRGQVVGRHRGVEFFTVGQRKGLGIASAEAQYVLAVDASTHQVIVGPESALAQSVIRGDQVVCRDPHHGAEGLWVKTRYRHVGLPVKSVQWQQDSVEIEVSAPDRAPAPGQSVVVYRGDVVVGGARMTKMPMPASHGEILG